MSNPVNNAVSVSSAPVHGQQMPGMKCPQGGEFIPTTIQHIITSSALVCPHCHLRLNIDRTKSGKAIDVLRKVQEAQENLERKTQTFLLIRFTSIKNRKKCSKLSGKCSIYVNTRGKTAVSQQG